MQGACSMEKEGKEDQKIDMLASNQSNLKKGNMSENLWSGPNQFSVEDGALHERYPPSFIHNLPRCHQRSLLLIHLRQQSIYLVQD